MAPAKDTVNSVHQMECRWQTPEDSSGTVEASFVKPVLVVVYNSGKVNVHCPVKGRHHDCTLEKDIPADMPKAGQ